MKIYIVMISVGEYSDRKENPVICVKSEDRAKELVNEYTQQLNIIKTTVRDKDYDNFELWHDEEAKKIMEPIAEFISEYSYPDDISYFYHECELEN